MTKWTVVGQLSRLHLLRSTADRRFRRVTADTCIKCVAGGTRVSSQHRVAHHLLYRLVHVSVNKLSSIEDRGQTDRVAILDNRYLTLYLPMTLTFNF